MNTKEPLSNRLAAGTSPGLKAYKAHDPRHCLESWIKLTGKEQENWEIFALRIQKKGKSN